MKNYLSFLLLLFFSSLHSQTIKIINEVTHEPIPFTSIKFYRQGKVVNGDYADQNGELTITTVFDSFELTCLGYKNKTIEKDEIKKEIALEPISFLLKEIIINKNNDLVEIGHANEKKGGISGVERFYQASVYIQNPYKIPVLIHSFLFNALKVKGRRTYRIHLYKKSDKGEYPGIDLLPADIVRVIEKGSKGQIEIDLSEYGIEMPAEGLYAAIEGLGGYDSKGNSILETNKSGFSFEAFQTYEYIYFIRPFFFQGKGWINVNEFLINDGVVDRSNKKNFLAPSFGLRVIKPSK
ncbi:hypothetical protein [Flavobacterium sp. NRK1]|uniref:hypothetical protein n=1 Tax=Flavobacterium sp. NRK1 TaxID=2954929 RepID=UPI0020930F81|nr:hypothetical protein [Flavobacterium sp. NRK1]MCO6146998.1 hypothetical protein [Flavobacterium sp. NRK1]